MELNLSNMMHSIVWHIGSYTYPTKKSRMKKLFCSKYSTVHLGAISFSDESFFPM